MALRPVQPLQNAKDTLLNERSGMVPDVRGGLLNYFRPMLLKRVTKRTVNLVLIEEEQEIQTSGYLAPAKQNLRMKPEGQRKWNAKTLFTLPVVILEPDDIVTVVNLVAGDTSYRVMSKSDYSENGYMQYELEEDYS